MTRILYLHGFNSSYSPENEKVKALSKIGEVIGIDYNTYDTYDNIHSYLLREITKLSPDPDDTLIVGTSLGGFWAAEMAAYLVLPSVIINPCYDPENMLQKYVGNQTNHKTGKVTKFSNESCLSYFGMKTQDNSYVILPFLLLDMEDEVIDSYRTKSIFEDSFPIKVFEGGNHRFAHMNESLEDISKYLSYCSFVENLNW
jgi:uncharacterized protein